MKTYKKFYSLFGVNSNVYGLSKSSFLFLLKHGGYNKSIQFLVSSEGTLQQENLNYVLKNRILFFLDSLKAQKKKFVLFRKLIMYNYKGFRLEHNLPLRGQRTRSSKTIKKGSKKKLSSGKKQIVHFRRSNFKKKKTRARGRNKLKIRIARSRAKKAIK